MNDSALFPCGRVNRRGFITQAAGGFFGAALGAVWAQNGKFKDARLPGTPKAKSVIFLFMCGGISHIDTFDPKDNKWAGTLVDAVGFGDNVAEMKRPVIPCLRTFSRYGKSGIPVSDWFPNVGSVVDEFAVVRSMWYNEGNHFPAVIETTTGHRGRQFDYPTLGAWISFALGSANKNLPTFVNMGRASSPVQLTGGYLGANVFRNPVFGRREPDSQPLSGEGQQFDRAGTKIFASAMPSTRTLLRGRSHMSWPRACGFTRRRWSISRKSRLVFRRSMASERRKRMTSGGNFFLPGV